MINVQEIVLKLRWWRDILLCGRRKKKLKVHVAQTDHSGRRFENFHILFNLFMKNVMVYHSQ